MGHADLNSNDLALPLYAGKRTSQVHVGCHTLACTIRGLLWLKFEYAILLVTIK